MQAPFVTFYRFTNPGLARSFTTLLNKAAIPFELTNESPMLDAILIGDTSLDANLHLKLRSTDFERAHALLEEFYQKQVDTVNRDYYLFSFSNEELMDIVAKPDEWNPFDYVLAKKLLRERGIEVNAQAVNELKQQRIQTLSKPETISRKWIIAGYLFSLVAGVPGIIIGANLAYNKKTLPDGSRVYAFTKKDRDHGKQMLLLASLYLLVLVLLKLFISMN